MDFGQTCAGHHAIDSNKSGFHCLNGSTVKTPLHRLLKQNKSQLPILGLPFHPLLLGLSENWLPQIPGGCSSSIFQFKW